MMGGIDAVERNLVFSLRSAPIAVNRKVDSIAMLAKTHRLACISARMLACVKLEVRIACVVGIDANAQLLHLLHNALR